VPDQYFSPNGSLRIDVQERPLHSNRSFCNCGQRESIYLAAFASVCVQENVDYRNAIACVILICALATCMKDSSCQCGKSCYWMDAGTCFDVYAVMRVPAMYSRNDVSGVANASSCNRVRDAVGVWRRGVPRKGCKRRSYYHPRLASSSMAIVIAILNHPALTK
jgi:hypothetical protein